MQHYMSEDQKRILNAQLWNIANTLRGKMDADEIRDYIFGSKKTPFKGP
jgi:type I restriction enzyme M protein